MQEKRAFQKDIDEAYKSTLKNSGRQTTKSRSLGQYAHGSSKIVRYWPKADISIALAHVRVWGKSGHFRG
jgi:hypothetical protein